MASFYAAYMAASGDQGPVTAEQNAVVVAVFSEPVTGLSTASFRIDGPAAATVTALKLLRGTNSYYHILLALPPAYYGAVTVNLVVRILCCEPCMSKHSLPTNDKHHRYHQGLHHRRAMPACLPAGPSPGLWAAE